MTHSTGANTDPTVFGDDATDFNPSRENLERIMTWNNEIGAIRTCATAAGCEVAPRGCPGTHLALRISTAVVEFFVEGIEAGAYKDTKEL
eukprot:SAG31_NODE_2236_length_6119_cov_15.764784_7_plen_90_part_00